MKKLTMQIKPFDNNKFLGYVSKVTPSVTTIHFPNSKLLKKFWHYNEELSGGVVGHYVVIESENYGFLGKLQEVAMPDNENIFSSESTFYESDLHAQGKVEIYFSFDFYGGKIDKGLNNFPAVGSKIYLCSSELLKQLFEMAQKESDAVGSNTAFQFCTTSDSLMTPFPFNPQDIFGRHCAIVGTTGGGKSYTITRLMEEFLKHSSGTTTKAILIDATGEYKNIKSDNKIKHIKFGASADDIFLHYSNLRVSDLFALFRPSGQSQKPKLLEAIKSLKLLQKKKATDTACKDNVWKKAKKPKSEFEDFYRANIAIAENPYANFDISNLSKQVNEECIWATDKYNANQYGDYDDGSKSYVVSLVSRIDNIVSDNDFKSIFGFYKSEKDANEFISILEAFLVSDTESLMIVSLESVNFDFMLREILVNTIGRILLLKARAGNFKEKPLLLFVDEAHQFLNKSVKDEYFDSMELDAFDKIAKECRKHGLFLCISTQMPRDIPVGTLSQMGTFIVHRLINEFDRAVIEKACSDANKYSLAYLPILKSGEALIVSVSLPMPIIVKIEEPNSKPDSKTPILFGLSTAK